MPLVIQDRAFNEDGSLSYTEDIDAGFMGDTIVVNGSVSPRFAERALYRLRFLNASNVRDYPLELSNGAPLVQIAGDGGLLEAPVLRPRSRWRRPSASTSWSTSGARPRALRSSSPTASAPARPPPCCGST